MSSHEQAYTFVMWRDGDANENDGGLDNDDDNDNTDTNQLFLHSGFCIIYESKNGFLQFLLYEKVTIHNTLKMIQSSRIQTQVTHARFDSCRGGKVFF